MQHGWISKIHVLHCYIRLSLETVLQRWAVMSNCQRRWGLHVDGRWVACVGEKMQRLMDFRIGLRLIVDQFNRYWIDEWVDD